MAGLRGFEPLFFGFLPRFLRPEADALIRAGQQTLLLLFSLFVVVGIPF
jgi:hypothetical protein